MDYKSLPLMMDDWWARKGSNLRPSGYEPRALPLSYGPQEHLAKIISHCKQGHIHCTRTPVDRQSGCKLYRDSWLQEIDHHR